MATILVLASRTGDVVDDAAGDAVAFAAGAIDSATVHALIIGQDVSPGAAAGLGAAGASVVHLARHPRLSSFAPDAWARIAADLALSIGADLIVAPATDVGNDLCARLAARLGVPFVANCLAVSTDDDDAEQHAGPVDGLRVSRQRWGGSLIEHARLHADRAVLSVIGTGAVQPAIGLTASIIDFSPGLDDEDLVVRVAGHVEVAATGVSLSEARVVISGGRGVGSSQGFAPLEDLAGLLDAAVGCTRAVTIAGWRPHTDQVGQTGTRIAPELYVACGVSGAIQHMVGCRAAGTILAINTDPEAPIMRFADYAVLGDLTEVVTAVAAEIRRGRSGTTS